MKILGRATSLVVAASAMAFGGVAQTQAQDESFSNGPCDLELTGDTSIEWRGLYGRGYEVTGTQQEFETLGVTVRHQGAACDYFLVATPNSAGSDNVLLGAGDRIFLGLAKSDQRTVDREPRFLRFARHAAAWIFWGGDRQSAYHVIFHNSSGTIRKRWILRRTAIGQAIPR